MLDLTQEALAKRAGCSVAAIRKLEHDERKPSPRMAGALAAALSVPGDEHAAFIRFARAGWADRPPAGPRLPLESPWLDQDSAAGIRPLAWPPPQTLRSVASDALESPPGEPRALAREAEMDRLARELDQALIGNGRAVLIAGEAGQGKTALMTAFAARAQATHPELVVVLGTCNAYTGRGDPFLPFREVLAQLTGEVPTGRYADAFERERARRLTRLVPEATRTLAERGPHLFDTLLPVQPLRARLRHAGIPLPPLPASPGPARPPTASPNQPEHDRQALRAETVASLTAIADRIPLLLLLDDLQWLDDSSAELLFHLTRAAAGHRLLLLGAFRPAELPPPPEHRLAPHPLRELTRLHTTTLDLDRADGRAFVDAWLDSEPNRLDEEFRAALTRQTAGHPLFTIELLRAMQERGDLVRDEARCWVTAATLRWDRLPTRIAEALAVRIERLPTGSMEVLRAAAVEGETFTAEAVARALTTDPRRVVRILGTELDRTHRLVAPVDVRRGSAGLVSRYRFRHVLIHRFVYDGVDPTERVYLHQGIAAALEALLAEDADPVALARHYTLAQSPDRAARHHRRAGDQARRTHALDHAVIHYRAALEHWPDPDPTARAALQLDLGHCQWLRMQLEDAERNLAEAGTALEAAGDLRAAGSAQVLFAMIAVARSDLAGAFDAARRAVAMLDPAGESAELAAALSNLGYMHALVSEFEAGADWGERAVAMAERVGARNVLPHALFCVGSTLPFLDPPQFEEGIALLERSFRLADDQGMAFEACNAAANLAVVLEGLGRHDEAEAGLRRCLAYAERHQIALVEKEARYYLWWRAWTHGDWSEAFALLPDIHRLVHEPASESQLPYAVWLAWSELDLGRAGEAHATLEGQPFLRNLVRPSDRLPYLADRLRAATALRDRSEADRAATAIIEAVSPVPPALEYDAIVPVVEALRHLTSAAIEPDDARITACLNTLGNLERRYRSPEAKAALREARALKAAREGSMTETAHLWTQAAEQWMAGAFPLHEARARSAAARALYRAGRRTEGDANLARARTLLSTLSEQIPVGELRDSFARATREMVVPD